MDPWGWEAWEFIPEGRTLTSSAVNDDTNIVKFSKWPEPTINLRILINPRHIWSEIRYDGKSPCATTLLSISPQQQSRTRGARLLLRELFIVSLSWTVENLSCHDVRFRLFFLPSLPNADCVGPGPSTHSIMPPASRRTHSFSHS